MKPERKVIYEPHPVSPARKAELRTQGYRIVDAKFAPRLTPPPVAATLPPPPAEKPKLSLPNKKA